MCRLHGGTWAFISGRQGLHFARADSSPTQKEPDQRRANASSRAACNAGNRGKTRKAGKMQRQGIGTLGSYGQATLEAKL